MSFELDVERKFGNAYKDFMRAVTDYSMLQKFERGVIVALSGGADSVFLLLCMNTLAKKFSFPICALHVNHNIRGKEADRDEDFCRKLCMELGVNFHSRWVDVPTLAKANGEGLELAARKARYNIFDEFARENENFSYVVTAHNATDNTETVVFNMLRGGGTQGVCGIPVVRDNILRPIIYISKKDIVASLEQNSIEYVFDSTNTDINYSRNYIRHEILPLFDRINPSFERAIRRLNNNVSSDVAYIEKQVVDFCKINNVTNKVRRKAIAGLDYAILSRVIMRMYDCARNGISGSDLEYNHIRKICCLLNENKTFSYNVPSGLVFCADKENLFVSDSAINNSKIEFSQKLCMGENFVPLSDGIVYLTDNKNDNNISKLINIYKLSIQAVFVFDKICGELYMRNRLDGDKYRYGGITHKLKKLYIDSKMSAHEKATLPVICDDLGILWVPGFGVRDAQKELKFTDKKIYALYCCNGGKNA